MWHNINVITISGHCKGCGLFFKSLRKHYSRIPLCLQKYKDDKIDVRNDPQFILSGPCRCCNKVFKSIRIHLHAHPSCTSAYDMEELKSAATERQRLNLKARDEKNKKKRSGEAKRERILKSQKNQRKLQN